MFISLWKITYSVDLKKGYTLIIRRKLLMLFD